MTRIAVAFASLVALVPASAHSAPVRPACHGVAVSPDFAQDRTALCGRAYYDGSTMVAVLYRTRDGGRTWAPAKATGLALNQLESFAFEFQFSPAYAADRRVFLATSAGLFVTTDLGETFTALDPQFTWTGFGNPGIYAGSAGTLAPALPGHRIFVAGGAGPQAARIDVASGLRQPVPGVTPADTWRFVTPAPNSTGAVLAITSEQPDPAKPDVLYSVWTCDDDLVCATRTYSFADGYRPERFWHIPVGKGRYDLAVLLGKHSSYRAMLSSDGGRTFRRWTALESAIAPMAKAMGPQAAPAIGLAVNAAKPGRVYLRVVGAWALGEYRWRAGAPPKEQVFRSDDSGKSFRRVSYGLGFKQPGKRGSIPWNTTAYGSTPDPAGIALAADGRLLVPAAREDDSAQVDGSASIYCSLDGGIRWSITCPR